MPIYFYNTRRRYGCFSNFAPYEIELDGKIWPTTEHYFQAQKFVDTKYSEAIRNASSPMKAAQMGRSRMHPIRSDWEIVKDSIMYKAVLKKFSTYRYLQKILLSTGDEEIIENTKNDYYWGRGKKGTGENILGKILMDVRKIIKQKRTENNLK